MAFRTWHVNKIKYCELVGQEVALENEVIYPAEQLPDQPPRVNAHRCSNAVICNQIDTPGCIWSGTNPDRQPL
jgi:hypothetical protein